MIKLIRRLEIIKSAITIEDEKLIDMQLEELHAYKDIESIQSIITSLSNYDYNIAIQSVNDFIKQKHGLIEVGTEEISSLKFELKSLENKMQVLSEQFNEINGEIQDFTHEYSLELGDVIRQLLRLKAQVSEVKLKVKLDHLEQKKDEYHKIKKDVEQVSSELNTLAAELGTLDEFSDAYEEKHKEYLNKQKDHIEKEALVSEQRKRVREAKIELDDSSEQQEYESIKQDEEAFENEYAELVDESLPQLTKDEFKELKKCYKKAAFLCHPDTVADEFKEQSHEFMVALTEARAKQDFIRIKEILHMLENGLGFEVSSDTINDSTVLRNKIDYLRKKVMAIKAEITLLQESDEYNAITVIEDLSAYLEQQKAQFHVEIKSVEAELASLLDVTESILEIDEIIELAREPQPQSHDDEDEYWKAEF
jgi:hypothetical protein